jgi:flagellar FliJ protein
MKFSFRLQTLLNWKKSLEEYSQMKLAEKIRQLKAQEEEINALMVQRLLNDQKLNEKAREGVRIGEYLLFKQFGEESYHDLIKKESQKKRIVGEIEGERENLIGFMKERKMFERLKEKKFEKFSYQVSKRDQKQMDEMAIRQHLFPPKEDLP